MATASPSVAQAYAHAPANRPNPVAVGTIVWLSSVLATTFVTKRFTHDQATRAIVTSYYWHFVDVVWIALFFMIYILK